jgi:transcriptional regulator with XRE-family HTH domain
MDDKIWMRKHSKKISELRKAGDSKGVRKLQFGMFIRSRRIAEPKLTQEQAAKLGKISRSQWARIEAGKFLPHPRKLSKIADAIDVQVGALYRKAGLEVPRQFARYDQRPAVKDFIIALKECSDFLEFIGRMSWIWQQYKQDQTSPGKRKSVHVDLNEAEVLEHLFELMNPSQRIRLARELVRNIDQKTIYSTLRDAKEFLKDFNHAVKLLEEKDNLILW